MHKKENNKYTHWLIAIATLVVVLLIGYMVHQYHVTSQKRANEEFNRTHFNPNVTIYNVNVGKKSVKSAYNAINKNGKDRATLKDNKIVFTKENKKIISLKQVEDYFDAQKTKYSSSRKWNFKNQELVEAENKLNKIKDSTVKYSIDGKEYQFSRKEYYPEVSYYDKNYHFAENDKLKQKLAEINKKVTTFYKKYPFKLPDGKTITVKNESYGWAINSKHLIPAIKKAWIENKSKIDGRNYIYGLGYSTYGTGYGMSNNGLGETYIVVSIKQQKVWFYRHGKKALVLNDVVTGTAATDPKTKTSDETPTGVWYIEYKESPSVLKGQNNDGSSYASSVKYWMPFTLSGCGFHDASWRTDWTKTAYLKGGSHGCVNIKPSEIKKVWDVVEQYEPVIVYK